MIEKQEFNDVTVLAIPESLDALNSLDLVRIITELQESGKVKIVIDMSLTNFIDSSGLSAIIVRFSGIRAEGGDIRLVFHQEYIRDQLRVTRLNEIFECYKTVDDAVESFG